VRTPLSKGQQAALCLIGLGLAFAGVWLMADELSWKSLGGLALILWGNNMSQRE
jgi:hypothetical protein